MGHVLPAAELQLWESVIPNHNCTSLRDRGLLVCFEELNPADQVACPLPCCYSAALLLTVTCHFSSLKSVQYVTTTETQPLGLWLEQWLNLHYSAASCLPPAPAVAPHQCTTVGNKTLYLVACQSTALRPHQAHCVLPVQPVVRPSPDASAQTAPESATCGCTTRACSACSTLST
jgi:hypothetical protein